MGSTPRENSALVNWVGSRAASEGVKVEETPVNGWVMVTPPPGAVAEERERRVTDATTLTRATLVLVVVALVLEMVDALDEQASRREESTPTLFPDVKPMKRERSPPLPPLPLASTTLTGTPTEGSAEMAAAMEVGGEERGREGVEYPPRVQPKVEGWGGKEEEAVVVGGGGAGGRERRRTSGGISPCLRDTLTSSPPGPRAIAPGSTVSRGSVGAKGINTPEKVTLHALNTPGFKAEVGTEVTVVEPSPSAPPPPMASSAARAAPRSLALPPTAKDEVATRVPLNPHAK